MLMNKILRYSLIAVLAMMGFSNAMAEDVIWSEDFSSYAANDVPAGCVDGNSATKVFNDNLAGGKAPELLIGKGGGSYTVAIDLNGKTGDMFLQYKANYDRVTLTCETAGVTIGDKENSGKSYTYPVNVPAGTSRVTFVFTNSNSSNVRFDDAKLYQGTAKKPAGLDWGTASRSVTIGADDNIFPELKNENNLPVTYSSSEQSVATIDGSGNVTLVAAGSTIISAAFDGNSEYEAQTVSYTLTVKENGGTEPGPTPEVQDVTVAQAIEIINGLDNGATTTTLYRVTGYIVGAPDFQRKTDGSLYGNVNMEMADVAGGSPTLTVYRGKSYDGANFTEDDVTANIIKEGDKVVYQGKLQKYVKEDVMTPELKDGILISVTSGITNITADKAFNGAIYNVAGQRVNAGYKGLVIMNGKKVVNK